MADIFLSYARKDRKRGDALAKALEGLGWSVFWDPTIPAGLTWDDYIGGELEKARCVVVAWSAAEAVRRPGLPRGPARPVTRLGGSSWIIELF